MTSRVAQATFRARVEVILAGGEDVRIEAVVATENTEALRRVGLWL